MDNSKVASQGLIPTEDKDLGPGVVVEITMQARGCSQ